MYITFPVPLQFDSVDSATLAAGLFSIEYDDCEVYLEQVTITESEGIISNPEVTVVSLINRESKLMIADESEEEDANETLLKDSSFVKVSNLPVQFDKVSNWILLLQVCI